MATMISSLASSGGIKAIYTGVVSTLTDTGFPSLVSLGSNTYRAPNKPERWLADVLIPQVNVQKCVVLTQGSYKIDELTYFRRPTCARLVDSTTLRVYADFTRYIDSFTTTVPSANIDRGVVPSDSISSDVNAHDVRWTIVEYF